MQASTAFCCSSSTHAKTSWEAIGVVERSKRSDKYSGLRPVSMPQSMFNILLAVSLMLGLFMGMFVIPFLFIFHYIGLWSLLAALALPIIILLANLGIYARLAESAMRANHQMTFDKAFTAVYFLTYIMLPGAAILIIERGNDVEGIVTVVLITILAIIALLALYGILCLIDYAIFSFCKREYQINKAAIFNAVSGYLKTNHPEVNAKINERAVISFTSKARGKSQKWTPNEQLHYAGSYNESNFLFPIPLLFRKRFRKADFQNCVVSAECPGFQGIVMLYDTRDVAYAFKEIDYLPFSVEVENGIFTDDLERQVNYYYAQMTLKPQFNEYLKSRYPQKDFLITEIRKYPSTMGYHHDYDDLAGDISASVAVLDTSSKGFKAIAVRRIGGLFSVD